MRPIEAAFTGLEVALLTVQLTSLAATHWTSWDLRFNWTQTIGDVTQRPSSDGQLVSQGHAGLWSRCVKVYTIGKDSNKTKLSDTCLSNFDDPEHAIEHSFGKVCKTATAGLCVGEAVVTLGLIAVAIATTFWRSAPGWLHHLSLPLVVLQGVVATAIPIVYISGNMAEMVNQLSSAYGLLLVVRIDAGYSHDWTFWIQVAVSFLWIAAIAVFMVNMRNPRDRSFRLAPANKNGRTADDVESTELETLRGSK